MLVVVAAAVVTVGGHTVWCRQACHCAGSDKLVVKSTTPGSSSRSEAEVVFNALSRFRASGDRVAAEGVLSIKPVLVAVHSSDAAHSGDPYAQLTHDGKFRQAITCRFFRPSCLLTTSGLLLGKVVD